MYNIVHFSHTVCHKGLYSPKRLLSKLGLSSPQRPETSGVRGWPASRMCGVEEEVRAGSLVAWWCVSDQSNAVPKRAETLGCCKICAERCKCLISWLSFLFPSVHLLLLSSLLVCLTLIVKLQHVIPSFAFKTNSVGSPVTVKTEELKSALSVPSKHPLHTGQYFTCARKWMATLQNSVITHIYKS